MARLNELTDGEVVALYNLWSEETSAASFEMLPPDDSLPASFIRWIQQLVNRRDFEEYEQELIQRWRKAMERP